MKNEAKFPETMEEILVDPHKFGFVTFEEFAKNPDAFRQKEEYLLDIAEKGSNILTKGGKYLFAICGYVVNSLEKVQAIATREGKDWSKMDVSPQIIPDVAGQFKIVVHFTDKKTK
jgi:hypothetical protein